MHSTPFRSACLACLLRRLHQARTRARGFKKSLYQSQGTATLSYAPFSSYRDARSDSSSLPELPSDATTQTHTAAYKTGVIETQSTSALHGAKGKAQGHALPVRLHASPHRHKHTAFCSAHTPGSARTSNKGEGCTLTLGAVPSRTCAQALRTRRSRAGQHSSFPTALP